MTTLKQLQTVTISVLVPVYRILGMATYVDEQSAEPVIHYMTLTQLFRKTARRKNDRIEIEGCGIWAL